MKDKLEKFWDFGLIITQYDLATANQLTQDPHELMWESMWGVMYVGFMWEARVSLVTICYALIEFLREICNKPNIFYLCRNIEYYRFNKFSRCVKNICEITYKSGRQQIVMNL